MKLKLKRFSIHEMAMIDEILAKYPERTHFRKVRKAYPALFLDHSPGSVWHKLVMERQRRRNKPEKKPDRAYVPLPAVASEPEKKPDLKPAEPTFAPTVGPRWLPKDMLVLCPHCKHWHLVNETVWAGKQERTND